MAKKPDRNPMRGDCGDCGGTGQVTETKKTGKGTYVSKPKKCTACKGTGGKRDFS